MLYEFFFRLFKGDWVAVSEKVSAFVKHCECSVLFGADDESVISEVQLPKINTLIEAFVPAIQVYVVSDGTPFGVAEIFCR